MVEVGSVGVAGCLWGIGLGLAWVGRGGGGGGGGERGEVGKIAD